MAEGDKEFGTVTLFDQCPICKTAVSVQVIGRIQDPTVDLTGMNIGPAMEAVNNLRAGVQVTALVVHHDCREYK